jgi:hypothetical protein
LKQPRPSLRELVKENLKHLSEMIQEAEALAGSIEAASSGHAMRTERGKDEGLH